MSIIDKKWLDEVWEKTDRKLSRTAVECREMLPYSTENGKWTERDVATALVESSKIRIFGFLSKALAIHIRCF